MKITIASAALLLVVSCTTGPDDRSPARPGAVASTELTAVSVATALRNAGLTVRDAGMVEQPFFPVPARVYVVSDEDVQVYEFPSAAEAERAAATVSPSGSTIGTTSMSWMAPPHFFRKDRLIVNHLGSNEKVLRALQALLGPQFAGR